MAGEVSLTALAVVSGMSIVPYATRAGGCWAVDRVEPFSRCGKDSTLFLEEPSLQFWLFDCGRGQVIGWPESLYSLSLTGRRPSCSE